MEVQRSEIAVLSTLGLHATEHVHVCVAKRQKEKKIFSPSVYCTVHTCVSNKPSRKKTMQMTGRLWMTGQREGIDLVPGNQKLLMVYKLRVSEHQLLIILIIPLSQLL